jgi:5-oxoprolinase (ATP-hydrolysing) subunit A
MKRMDLNCDMGELPEAIADGTQEALMPFLTSVNIACGGHAGNQQTMQTTIEQALRWKLAIGAHPGYPDRANFGRLEVNVSPQAVADFVYEQLRTLAARSTIRLPTTGISRKRLRKVLLVGGAMLC